MLYKYINYKAEILRIWYKNKKKISMMTKNKIISRCAITHKQIIKNSNQSTKFCIICIRITKLYNINNAKLKGIFIKVNKLFMYKINVKRLLIQENFGIHTTTQVILCWILNKCSKTISTVGISPTHYMFVCFSFYRFLNFLILVLCTMLVHILHSFNFHNIYIENGCIFTLHVGIIIKWIKTKYNLW